MLSPMDPNIIRYRPRHIQLRSEAERTAENLAPRSRSHARMLRAQKLLLAAISGLKERLGKLAGLPQPISSD